MKYIDVEGGRVPAIGFGTFAIQGEDCVRATAAALEAFVRRALQVAVADPVGPDLGR